MRLCVSCIGVGLSADLVYIVSVWFVYFSVDQIAEESQKTCDFCAYKQWVAYEFSLYNFISYTVIKPSSTLAVLPPAS